MQIKKRLWYLLVIASFSVAMDRPSIVIEEPDKSFPCDGKIFKVTVANQTDYDIPYEFAEMREKTDIYALFRSQRLTKKLSAGSDTDFSMVKKFVKLKPNDCIENQSSSLIIGLESEEKKYRYLQLHICHKEMCNVERIVMQRPEWCSEDSGVVESKTLKLARYELLPLSSVMLIINPGQKIQIYATF